jgi:hypothetical protein
VHAAKKTLSALITSPPARKCFRSAKTASKSSSLLARLEPEAIGSQLDSAQLGLSHSRGGRVDEQTYHPGGGNEFVQQLQPLRRHFHD